MLTIRPHTATIVFYRLVIVTVNRSAVVQPKLCVAAGAAPAANRCRGGGLKVFPDLFGDCLGEEGRNGIPDLVELTSFAAVESKPIGEAL